VSVGKLAHLMIVIAHSFTVNRGGS